MGGGVYENENDTHIRHAKHVELKHPRYGPPHIIPFCKVVPQPVLTIFPDEGGGGGGGGLEVGGIYEREYFTYIRHAKHVELEHASY